jgi:hypothetical protein
MSDEQRKAQQLDTARRLRVMQTQKARLQQARTQRQRNEAERYLQKQQSTYEHMLGLYADQKQSGSAVDPFLYEQRLLIQLSAYAALQQDRFKHDDAQRDNNEALKYLVAATTQEKVATRAYEQSILRLQKHQNSQQIVDLSDAQLARYPRHGF